MIVRILSGLAAVSLLCSALPLSARVERCGFATDAARIELMSAGVPLLLAPMALPVALEPRMMARRARVLEGERACTERYPETTQYLRSILARLVRGSGLERFAVDAPRVELVLACSAALPLPVARALAGKVLLVPRALPELAASEDAIAAVLAHELAHLTLRHSEQLIEATSGALAIDRDAARELKHTHEREADVAGLRIAASAGYDSRAAADHLRAVVELAGRLERSGMRSRSRKPAVHDAVEERERRIREQIEVCEYPSVPVRAPIASAVTVELAAEEADEAR